MQWTGDNREAVASFAGSALTGNMRKDEALEIMSPEGLLYASVGHWLIQDVRGGFYPCDPEVFKQTYEQDKGQDGPF